MSFQEVNRLRKARQLEEALQLASEDLQSEPENIWSKRALGWVYYEFAKKTVEENNINGFLIHVEEIKDLNLPQGETMLNDSLAWQIGKLLYANKLEEHHLNKLFKLIKNLSFTQPCDQYSFMIKAFNKYGLEWDGFLDFVEWWDLSNFQQEDFVEFITDRGQKLPSAAESIYINISKKLLVKPYNFDAIRSFIPKIAGVSEQHTNMQYPPYYHAKLLIALGDKQNFMKAFLPFARKKQKNFWVWDLMSEVLDINSKEYLSCLCKSLMCGAPDKFTINVREKLAEALIHKKQYPEAKYELKAIIDTRTKEAWTLKQKHQDWKNYPWWNSSADLKDNFNLYKNNVSIAKDLLFSDIEEELLVVERVNREKTVLNFIVSKQKHGLIFYGKHTIKPTIGEVYAVRFKNDNKPKKSSFYQILSIRPSEQKPPDEICKQIQAKVIIKTGNSFGFIERAYVPAPIIKKYELIDGEMVKARVIQSFNNKHKTWGWLVISIQK